MSLRKKNKLHIVVSEDWSFWSHRLSLALSAINAGYEVTLITNVNKLEKEIQAKGIKIVNVNFTRSSKFPFTDILNIFKLFFIFKKEKPDVIHNVALKTIIISSIASFFVKNVSVINAFTGLGYVFSSKQMQANIIRVFVKPFFLLLTRKSNVWTIFQNPDDMTLFSKLRLCSSARSVLIRGSGVDTEEFPQSKDLNDVPVVMLASRMLWDKGVDEFVEAAKRINKKEIKAKFILVGDVDAANPMSIPVEKLNEWTKNGYVHWIGHSNNMPETLASASIICLPSYREGLPKVLLEAAAIGRPLIATDVPGCREIVRDGENGILVGLKDIDSLTNAINTLVLDDKMRVTMGLKSRTIIETELSAEIINKQTVKLYELANKNEHL